MDGLSRDELILLVQQQQAQLAECNARLAERDALIAVQQEHLDAQREVLESLANEVKLLKRALFGHRRERFVDDPRQRMLFESEWLGAEPGEGKAVAEESEGEPLPRKRRRGGKRGRIVIPESLPRKQVVHPLREEDLPEHLRGRDDLRRFRKLVGQYVEWVEASAYVVEEYVEVLAADNADATATEMQAASRPPRILDSYVGPGLLAGIATERFADFLPYYRVEERLGRVGLAIARSTIARWMIDLSRQLLPVIERMREEVLASDVLCIDETPVKLLRPGCPQAVTAYLWTTVGDAAHPYNAFYFTENRSRAGPERFLGEFSGVLVSDAYVGYESLQSAWKETLQIELLLEEQELLLKYAYPFEPEKRQLKELVARDATGRLSITPYFLSLRIGDLCYLINQRTRGRIQDELIELCDRLEYVERTGDGSLDLV